MGPIGRETFNSGARKPSCEHREPARPVQSCCLAPCASSRITSGLNDANAASASWLHSAPPAMLAGLMHQEAEGGALRTRCQVDDAAHLETANCGVHQDALIDRHRVKHLQ